MKMKRMILFVCCIALLFALPVQPVMAGAVETEYIATGLLGDHVTFTFDGSYLDIRGEGPMWDFAVAPEGLGSDLGIQLDGKPSPLKDLEGIDYIHISGDVTRIGTGAFPDCRELRDLWIESNIEEIGSLAFNQLITLETMKLPKSIKKLEPLAFSSCWKLYGVEFMGDAPELCHESFNGKEYGPFRAPAGHVPTLYHSKDAEGWTDGEYNGYQIRTIMPFPDYFLEHSDFSLIQNAWERGLILGMEDGSFAPNGLVSRAQLLTVMYRLEGDPSYTATDMAFPDMKPDRWYSDAICWAKDNGIVLGYPDGTVRPDQPVTRQELAAIMHRCADGRGNQEGFLIDGYYDEEEISTFAVEPMMWATRQLFREPYADAGFLGAFGRITRGELLKILKYYEMTINGQ